MAVRVGELTKSVRRLAMPVLEDDVTNRDAKVWESLGRTLGSVALGLFRRTIDEKAFTGRSGESHLIVLPDARPFGALLVIGVGRRSSLKLEGLRSASGIAARRLARSGRGGAGFVLGAGSLGGAIEELGDANCAQAIAEGWELGSYLHDVYKSPESSQPVRRKKPATLTLVALASGAGGRARAAKLRAGAKRGQVIGEASNYARDLANTPANDLGPEELARRARALGRGEPSLTVKVLGEADLRRLRMGAFLAVAQGSARPPRLLVVEYRPRRGQAARTRTVALVGKAITFDSGGLSIKTARGMEDMKFDMSGGAAVLGVLRAAAALRADVRIVGLVAASENMISGRAMRPGDIVRAGSGTTIEIINTDAEGRLVLADALHFALRYKPDCIVDLATLTGACVVGLGTAFSGLMGNDETLVAQLLEAGSESGERLWRLPLEEDSREAIRGTVGDIKNSAGRNGGALTAAAFLSHFVGGRPWCHIDIAGTAWTERDNGYLIPGATGVGVRLLSAFLARGT